MDVTLRNTIELCPEQCAHADIRVRRDLVYGPRKTSVTGVDVVVTCDHVGVCKTLLEALGKASR